MTSLFPLMARVAAGADSAVGFWAGSLTIQRPSAPASTGPAVTVSLPIVSSTVTFSPGEAVPQTGISRPACRTMWSVNSSCGFTAAAAGPDSRARPSKAIVNRFIKNLAFAAGDIF